MKFKINRKKSAVLRRKAFLIYTTETISILFLLLLLLWYSHLIESDYVKIFMLITIVAVIVASAARYRVLSKKLAEICINPHQYVIIRDDGVEMNIYDEVQNAGLEYHTDEPIMHQVNFNSIKKVRIHPLYVEISGWAFEKFDRRQPFIVEKDNMNVRIYRVFSGDKKMIRYFRDLEGICYV